MKFILILTGIILLAGCSKETEREPPQTVSDVLNEMVRSAPYQYINMDEIEVQEIQIPESDILYSVYQQVEADEPIIGWIRSMAYANDRFFIYDFSNVAIYSVDMDGTVNGPLTREGKGPGEHEFVNNLKANNQFVYAPDANNGRINRYTHDMEIVEALPEYMPTHLTRIDLNNERILTGNRRSAGFAPSHPEQGLIAIHPVDDISDTLATILTRIIPVGYQPNVYNSAMFSVNNKNQIAASYRPLQWIFLFNEEYNHSRTLILESELFDKMNIPPMDFFKPKGNQGFGGSNPLTQFTLMDNNDLFITVPGEVTPNTSSDPYVPFGSNSKVEELHLLHLSASADGSYAAKALYDLIGQVSGENIHIEEMTFSEERNLFFGSNREYLFRFELPGN